MLILIALVLAAGVGWRYWRNGEARQSQRPPASAALATAERPFTLVDPTGRPVTDRDFRGKFMLIYFGYSACADHCPTMLMTAAGALKALGSRASQVQPIFITVDPAHDTPQSLAVFAQRMGADLPGWRFATGAPAEVEVLTTRMQAFDARRGQPRPQDHRTSLYLFDASGALVQRFGGVPVDRPRLADELSRLVRQRPRLGA